MNERERFGEKCELVNFVNFSWPFSFVLHDRGKNRSSCIANDNPGGKVHIVHKFTEPFLTIFAGFLGIFATKKGGAGGKQAFFDEYFVLWLTYMRLSRIFAMANARGMAVSVNFVNTAILEVNMIISVHNWRA